MELPRDYTLKLHWPDCSGMVAGIESECWPDSYRKGGRFQAGMVDGFVRNTHGKTVVLLLIGGDKSTQQKDIETAKAYWKRQKEE